MPSLFELAQFTPEELVARQQALQAQAADALPEAEKAQDPVLSAREHLDNIRDTLGRRFNDEAIETEFNNLVGAYESGVAIAVAGVKLQAREIVASDDAKLATSKDVAFGGRLRPIEIRAAVKTIVLGDVLSSIGVPTEVLDNGRSGPTSELAQNITPVVERAVRANVSSKAQKARWDYEHNVQNSFVVDETTGFTNENISNQIVPELDKLLDPLLRQIASDVVLLKKAETSDYEEAEVRQRRLGGFVAKTTELLGKHKGSSAVEQNAELSKLLKAAAQSLATQINNVTGAMGSSLATTLLNEARYDTIRDDNITSLENALNDFYSETITEDLIHSIDEKVKKTRSFYNLKKYVFDRTGKDAGVFDGEEDENVATGVETDFDEDEILKTLNIEFDELLLHYKELGDGDDRIYYNRAVRRLARNHHSDIDGNDSPIAIAENEAILKVVNDKFKPVSKKNTSTS